MISTFAALVHEQSVLPNDWLAPASQAGLPPRRLDRPYAALPSPAGAVAPGTVVPADLSTDASTTLGWLLALGAGRRAPRGDEPAVHRVYPTSGNLQSVQTYVIDVAGLLQGEPMLLHYDPLSHGLAPLGGLGVCPGEPGFFVLFTSTPVRQVIKYGVRGLRYAWLDLGHALGALQQAARALGLHAALVAARRAELATSLQLEPQPSFDDVDDEIGAAVLWIPRAAGAVERAQACWRSVVARAGVGRAPRAGVGRRADPELSAGLRALHSAHTDRDGLVASAELAGAVEASPGGGPESALAVLRRRTPRRFDPDAALSRGECQAIVRRIEASTTASDPARRLTRRLYWVHSVTGMSRGLYAPASADARELVPLHVDDLRDDAQFLASFQDKARDCALLVTIVAARADLASYESAHIAAGITGQIACQVAAELGLCSSGLGAFFDGEAQRFLASFSIQGYVLYWVALGRPGSTREVQ